MTSIDGVKRALRALATRTDTARPPSVAIVSEAEAALADVQRAAAFVDTVGLDRLDAAVTEAADVGRTDAAERGREALAAYRSFRSAASDGTAASNGETGGELIEADHFHRARGTHKRGAGQGSGE